MKDFYTLNYDEITGLAGIYLFTNKKNGKMYVGKTNDLRHRIRRSYPSEMKNPKKETYFLSALRKYTLAGFYIEFLELYSMDQLDFFLNVGHLPRKERMEIISKFLCNREAGYIKKLNTTDRTIGYNRCAYSMDNSGKVLTEEQRIKCGSGMRGKKHSEETKKKIGKAHAGEKHWAYGKKMKPESIEKMRASMIGKKHTPEACLNMRKGKTTKKPVHQLDPVTGEILRTFESVKEACRQVGASEKRAWSLMRVIKGERKRFRGFGWKLANKEETNESLFKA